MAKHRGSFRDRVIGDAKEKKTGGFSYLNIPDGVTMFSVEVGDRIELDFVPYVVTDKDHPDRNDEKDRAIPDSLWYKRPFRTHQNVGPNNIKIVCPRSVNKKCPICEYRKTKADNGASKEDLRELNSSLRHLYAVIPRDHKKYKEEVHVWDISAYCFHDLLVTELKANEDNGIFPDLEEGKTLRIRFGEKQIGKTKFPIAERIDFDDRKPISEKILDDVPDLDNMLKILSYDEIHEKFFDLPEDEPDEDDVKGSDREDRQAREERSSSRRDRDDDDDKKKDDDKEERRRGRDRDDDDDKKEERRSRRDRDDDDDKKKDEDKEERSSRGNGRDRGNGHDKDEKEERRSSKGKDDDLECPHGHRFGIDTDKKKACNDCKIWEKCAAAKEKRDNA